MNDDYPNDNGPSVVEIVYKWPDGREEVRYRRAYGSDAAVQLINEVRDLQLMHGSKCPYSFRYV